MEITHAKLQKLVSRTAPVVGISRPADKPFAVERSRLAGLIDGLDTCQISLNAHLEIQAPARRYKVHSLDVQRSTDAYKLFSS